MAAKFKFKFYAYIWAVCSLPFLVMSFVLNPDKLSRGEYSFVPVCLSLKVFGTECVGCGFSRAMSLFAHGRLEESLSHNKMGCVIFMLILTVNLFLAFQLFKKFKRSSDIDLSKKQKVN